MQDRPLPNESPIEQAMRALGLPPEQVEKARVMLAILAGERRRRRKPVEDEARTLEAFFQFALPLAHHAHGQVMQDLWALWELGSRRDGYFVEFGATNGVTMSNTYMLEAQYGWQGILAEPNPEMHDRLHRTRSAQISHKCVYARTGETMTFLLTEKPMFSRLAAINPRDHNEAAGRRKVAREVTVQSISLNDLLDEHDAPDEIDYVSIDTEGSELSILSTFDFARRHVRLFTVEHNFTPMRAGIQAVMEAHGYVRRFPEFSRADDWYVHGDLLV